jgi:heat shock protein HslJ
MSRPAPHHLPIAAAVILICCVLAACGGPRGAAPSPAASGAAAPGAGTSWRLIELGGEPVPEALQATIAFPDGGRVAGRAGCNAFTGVARFEGGRLAIDALATTRRACDPPAMAFEQRYLAALAAARGLRRDGAWLAIDTATGGVPLRFRAQP